MITTGKVTEKLSDSVYKVYLPIFQNAGCQSSKLNTSIYTANCCVDSFVYKPFEVGDLVYVGFVNNRISNPVILGKILKDDVTKPAGYIYADSMKVENNLVLPLNTSIVSSDGKEQHLFSLKFLEQQLDELETLSDKIDYVKNTSEDRIDEVYNTLNKGITSISSSDSGKIVSIDSSGNFSPVANKGLFNISSTDAGKYLIIDSNGDIVASTQTQSELYTHYITMIQEAGSTLAPIHNVVMFNITTLLANPFSAVSIIDYINSQYFLGPSNGDTGIVANGTFKISGNHHYVAQVRKGDTAGTINIVTVSSSGGTNTPTAFAATDVTSMTDYVVRIF